MKPLLRYLGLAVGAYLLMLVITLPATHLNGWFGAHLPQLKLHTPGGTLWSGNAASVRIDNTTLENVEWCYAPTALLSGRIGFNTQIESRIVKGEGLLSIDAEQLVGIDGLTAISSLAQLPLPPMAAAVKPTGKLELRLTQARLAGKQIKSLTGELIWRDASFSLAQPVALGDLKATFATNEQGLQIDISDLGGDLQTNLKITIDAKMNYRLNGNLNLRNQQRLDLQQLLSMLGARGNSNRAAINLSGRLPQLPLTL